jgi:hypothetical protein
MMPQPEAGTTHGGASFGLGDPSACPGTLGTLPTYPPIPYAGRAASRYPAACSSGIKMATAATVSLRVSPPPS